jgi:hypothetical protein
VQLVSARVISIGAICFGVVIGYITYRTLARSDKASVSDIAAVVAAVGGGTVTTLFDRNGSDSFGWYAMGLLAGMALYLGLSLLIRGRKETALVMAAGAPLPETSGRVTGDDIRPERPARR